MPFQNPFSDHKKVSAHAPINRTNIRIQANRRSQSYEAGQRRQEHAEAQQRVYRILDALQLVSRPFGRPISKTDRIETYIDILEPYRLQGWPLVSHPKFSWWRPPNDAVSPDSYSLGQTPKGRDTHYREVESDLVGWVFPFIMGGRKPVPTKDIALARNPHTLIIPKRPDADSPWRSWMGGIQANGPKAPRILEIPEKMATGSTLSLPYQGGWHNDHAIEGMTALGNTRYNPGEQIERLWTIGNAVIGRGKLAEVNFVDALSTADQEPKAPHVR
jgi:hypothetical protein